KPGAKAEARTLRGEVGRVWLDGIRQPTLDVSVPLIGAPVAWQAGFTGQGVPVGVVDTGIDDSHPDLAGKVIAAQNFTDETDTVGGGCTVGSPGSADDALTVGAVTKKEELADFSSRGPRIGDSAIKPDITAPGVDITAARGKDGVIGNPGDLYATISGTSMAT